MSYSSDLPRAFPFRVEAKAENVEFLVRRLMERDPERFTHGTSFAVTSDVTSVGNRVLWLSKWSAIRLWKRGYIAASLVGQTRENMQLLAQGQDERP